MTDTPTPGQVNYEAYCADAPDVDPALPFLAWDELPPGDRHAWEAAAAAVRTQLQEAWLRRVLTPAERAAWDAAAAAVRAQQVDVLP